MHKMRLFAVAVGLMLLLGAGVTAVAEQLTTVAVFDMDQVLLSFYSDSDVGPRSCIERIYRVLRMIYATFRRDEPRR